MKLYLVREAETTKVHGIFWASNPAGLWDAVDEMADPAEFEWTQVTMPSGVWRDETLNEALAIPDRGDFPETDEGEEAFDEAFDRALEFGFISWGDHLRAMIIRQDEHVWTRFDYADEGVGVVARIFEEVHGQGKAKAPRPRPKP